MTEAEERRRFDYDHTGRTPQDYAIEHAGYLAQAADAAIAAVNGLHKLYQQLADGELVNPGDIENAEQSCSEGLTSLREHVYEFRKRRDRAAGVKASDGKCLG
jgi:predicted phosphodiesterase